MEKELEFWNFVNERSLAGEAVALLIVVESSGSSPGRVGFKMAVAKSDMYGSIGGGVMEINLVEDARNFLDSPPSDTTLHFKQVHRENSTNPSGMICSGEQTVLMRRVGTADDVELSKIIEGLARGTDVNLTVTAKSLEAYTGRRAPGPRFTLESENEFEYIERLNATDDLVIFGGGHCSLALSELMKRLGFRVSLYDDRPNLNTIEKNQFADEIEILEDYERVGEFVESNPNTFVVVMTVGFKSDKIVIKNLLGKDFRYFGVLGSKAKMAALKKELKDEGSDESRLAMMHTPIGLEINSRTPEEIAVSIAAEIIRIKNA